MGQLIPTETEEHRGSEREEREAREQVSESAVSESASQQVGEARERETWEPYTVGRASRRARHFAW